MELAKAMSLSPGPELDRWGWRGRRGLCFRRRNRVGRSRFFRRQLSDRQFHCAFDWQVDRAFVFIDPTVGRKLLGIAFGQVS